jgi:hypothetical protein
MFNARDKSAVLSWTERQLGDTAVRATVVEVADHIVSEWVEKSGTGIKCTGCLALLSVMADSIQNVGGSEPSEFKYQDRLLVDKLRIHKATVH